MSIRLFVKWTHFVQQFYYHPAKPRFDNAVLTTEWFLFGNYSDANS